MSSINDQCPSDQVVANTTEYLSTEVNILFDAVLNVFYFATFIVNCICIHVMFTTPHLRKTSAFVMYQSCNDALFALVSIILFLCDKTLSESVPFNFPGVLHSYISYSCIILISLERWVYLIYPYYHKSITSRKIIVFIVSTLGISFFVSCPFCYCDNFDSIHMYFVVHHKYIFPVFHVVCLIFLVFIYTHITVVLYNHYKQISRLNKSVTDVSTYRKNIEDLNSRKWNSFMFVFLVSCSYLLLVSPFTGAKAYAFIAESPGSSDFYIITRVAHVFHTVSHFSNFIVYSLKSPGFKDTFKEKIIKLKNYLKAPFLKCRQNRKKSDAIQMSTISSETLFYQF